MCLYAKSRTVHTAKQDITVYKRLKTNNKNNKLKAPVRNFTYVRKKLMKTNANFEKQLDNNLWNRSIDKGFHAFKSAKSALRSGYSGEVFVATVPKGAKYVNGEKNQIASDQIRIERKWVPIKK